MTHAISLSLLVCGLLASEATAHYNMLLPQAATGKRGEPVTITYQWGHPFEHQLFDSPAPQSLVVFAPDGTTTDLKKAMEVISSPGVDGKKASTFHFRFTPEERGDYLFLLKAAPIWMEEDQEFLEDAVKVVLHVQAQKGWDTAIDRDGFEMLPLTRPYGLAPGMVFQARVLAGGRASADTLVEIERYNATPPKKLPADEQITRTAKTDPNGVVTCTLTEPGWWCITAQRDGGMRERAGKSYPVRQRSTFWAYVDERPGN